MIERTMEELLPIVSRLAERYTGKESTSVSYEKARQLMGAVLYCIEEFENGGEEDSVKVRTYCDAKTAYEAGFGQVVQKVMKAKEIYEELIADFDSYGSRALEDTVQREMPEFFLRYDARFAPADHLLTLDYPVLKNLEKLQGVDRIYEYLKCIRLEQKFLSAFSPAYVRGVLSRWNTGYRELFENISGQVLRGIIGDLMTGRKVEEEERAGTEAVLSRLIRFVVEQGYEGDPELYEYLKCAAPNCGFPKRTV